VKDDRVYLRFMLRCISRIQEYAGGKREQFLSTPLIQDGVLRNLQVLAESSQRLSENVKTMRPEVDWAAVAGFRNVLVHDYLGVDLEQVYRIVECDVPQLKAACEAALDALGPAE
jgi:uncharacterized protein with HEPN domain